MKQDNKHFLIDVLGNVDPLKLGLLVASLMMLAQRRAESEVCAMEREVASVMASNDPLRLARAMAAVRRRCRAVIFGVSV